MVRKTVAEINQYEGTTVNPMQSPEQVYELYSVPSFDTEYPEIIAGADIGSSKVTVQEGDVLICKINPRINRVWVVKHNTEHPLLASSEWIVVRNPGMDSDYLRWYFSSSTFRTLLNSEVAGIGGSLTRAQPKRVAQYTVPICPFEEQQRISASLNQVESLISLRKQQIAKLDELVKARFVEMFGDPVSNPKGWDKVNISTVVGSKVSNGFFAKRDDYCDDGNVSVLGVAHVVNRMYSNTVDLPKTNGSAADVAKYGVKYGDMLFCRSSLVAEGIGKASIVPQDVPENVLFECHVIRLPLDLEKCVPEFMQVLSTTEYFRSQVIAQSKTATMTTIGQDGILKTEIILPPLELQKHFQQFVAQTDQQKLTIQYSLAQLELLKKALMQKYFG